MARTPVPFQSEARAPGGAGFAEFTPQRIATNPDMFGAAGARALANTAQTLSGLGGTLQQYAANEQAIQDDTEATNLHNSFVEKSGALFGQYQQMQGQEAIDFYPQMQEQLRSLRDETVGAASSDRLRRKLNAAVGGSSASMLGQAAGMNARNVRVAGVQAQESAGVLAINQGVAAGLNPDALSSALTAGLETVDKQGTLLGWDAATLEAKRTAYRGNFFKSTIMATADKDPLAAQALFDANRGKLDAPTQIQLESALRAPVRNRQAGMIVAGVTGSGMGTGLPPQPGQPGNMQGGVGDQVWAAEGGAAKNPQSSARGGGITDGTWKVYAKRLGLGDELRGTREGFNQVWAAYQADARQAVGRDLTPNEQYTAWFLGVEGAKSFIQAPPGADAQAIYASVAGKPVADQAFKANGKLLVPGMTVQQALGAIGDYFQKHAGSGGGAGGTIEPVTTPKIGRDVQMQAALTQAGTDPELRTTVLTKLREHWAVEDAMNAQEKAKMVTRISALGDALALGTEAEIPEADIRRLFQPEQATEVLDKLSVKRIEGHVFRSVQLATPADIAAMQDDLANGTGAITAQLRERRGTVLGPDGSVAEEDRAGDIAARQDIAQVMNRALEARAGQLKNDPAQYVLADPAVRAAAQAQQANPGDPSTMDAYITATLAAQERLGVPEGNRRVLGVNIAAAEAARLMGNDPAGGDASSPDNAALRLQSMSRQYGQHWPRVFGDLVRDGKLPGSYQVLANIPTPVGQADFQRMLNLQRLRGGHQQFASAVPDASKKAIDDGVEGITADFRASATAGQQQGGYKLAADVQDSVRDLAYYYAIGGMNPNAALQTAADRIYNDKYEFSGTMRVPKVLGNGQPVGIDAAQRGATTLLRGLKAEDLAAPPSSNPALTEADRQKTAWSAAQRGVWVPNQDDTGMVLLADWEMGGRVPVRRTDGSIVELKYNALPQRTVVPDSLRGVGGYAHGDSIISLPGAPAEAQTAAAAPDAAPRTATGPAPVSTAPIIPGTQQAKSLGSASARGTGRWARPEVNQ